MSKDSFAHGTLLTEDYLEFGIQEDPDWGEVSPEELADRLRPIYERFPFGSNPNESTTENELIWPVLEALGWSSYLRQQNLSSSGRNLVPDGLLFLDEEAKDQANAYMEEWKRYRLGVALVESKRWNQGTAMDKSVEEDDEGVAAATQILYYLRRADVLTNSSLQWGILTDGLIWRLYWQGARSVADQYFQIDLAGLLGFDGDGAIDGERSIKEREQDMRWLRIFAMTFRRNAFKRTGPDLSTYPHRAVKAGRFYEARVSKNLSDKVFSNVFPALANAILVESPGASHVEIRDTALIVMYRLLFIFFAEDRGFLPVGDRRYDDYSLRDNVRMDIKRRMDANDAFSSKAARYWLVVEELSRLVESGDSSIGLPPYNGGLFDSAKLPLLESIRIADEIMASIVDELSFEIVDSERRYINYKDLSVQHLGSIYERLLEHELRADQSGRLELHPNPYARKSSGSYYTPDDLIRLIIEETIDPIIEDCKNRYFDAIDHIKGKEVSQSNRRYLEEADPASAIMKIKACDPAMGSGPFLVQFVDYLTDQIMGAMMEAATLAGREGYKRYRSPLYRTIKDTANQIVENAKTNNWTPVDDKVIDYKVVRRMVLKRCVYGVDKNEMAVELAKVSLWLHSFTVGAPLSFIDHHLRCGDSLFGEWVESALGRTTGHAMFLESALSEAEAMASDMQQLDRHHDIEIDEMRESALMFDTIVRNTFPLNLFMKVLHAIQWVDIGDEADKAAVGLWLDGKFGNPIGVLLVKWNAMTKEELEEDERRARESKSEAHYEQPYPAREKKRFDGVLERAKAVLESERFLNWEVEFPGVWENWKDGRVGGFDAVIGNPPWDRIKFQQVEWLAVRRPEIARTPNANERKRRAKRELEENQQLALDWNQASERTARMSSVARTCGEYPLLSGGDINIYTLFVERSMSLLNARGMLGLLTPSGIASDKSSSNYFRAITSEGRLSGIFDFSNRRRFFQDVTPQFKFCALIASKTRVFSSAKCAFFLQSPRDLEKKNRVLRLTAKDFRKFNPNTVTAPVFRSKRDFDIASKMYDSQPVLADLSSGKEQFAWPVRQHRMFDMTNDSDKFRTAEQLTEIEKAWSVGNSKWQSEDGIWVPLYVGKMFHQFDHRAASIEVNEMNVHNAGLSDRTCLKRKIDPSFTTTPQYWVREDLVTIDPNITWFLAFRDTARVTDSRTMIASAIPRTAVNNKAPILLPTELLPSMMAFALLLGNFNSIVFDFVVRQKVHGANLNWFIVEQLPVVPEVEYFKSMFGHRSAGDTVNDAVFELTYTAHDMAPFAVEQGYVDKKGRVRKPFKWDEMKRLRLRAKLDAVYFHLYGIYDAKDVRESRDDISYIYSTFPIVEKNEMRAYGRYLSRDLALAYCNALASGDSDAEPVVEPSK